jgi:hypothetical protein
MTRVSGNVIEGKSPPFPAGTFIGRLAEGKNEWYASDRNNPDKKDGVRLILTFKENSPVEGPVVGARPMIQRLDIVLPPKAGKDSISLVDVTEIDDSTPFQLRQTATLLSQLALAWGAITRTDDGSADVDFNQFISDLEAGVYNAREVMFSVEQRTVESKTQKGADGKAKVNTYSGIVAFKGTEESATPEAATPAAEGGLRTRA